MNLHAFLIIDSVLLDVAGVAALFEGETELGLALLLVAALTFIGGLTRRRQVQTASV
ncbi:MAG: hypothetical protein LC792_17180 [Actinobacteria bacterium]|nr:hypothetical protein [Actinomycetota bacterium]